MSEILPVTSTAGNSSNSYHAEKGHVEDHIDLNNNFEARIKNPLAHIPTQQLLRNVEIFAQEKGLEEHVGDLKKGALVAKDPNGYEDIKGEHKLDEAEIEVLRNEVLHKWRIPKRLILTILTCSIGAAVQGWDQTGSNGANLSFPTVFGIGSGSDYDEFLVGLINSMPYLASACVGCWLSDPLNNKLGRRGTIFFSAHFCFWPVLGSAFCQNWHQLLICRFLLGIGMGSKASTVPIYAAENSPAPIRGALVMSWQMWTAFGIFLGTAANLAVAKIGPIAWRLQLGSAFIPAVPLIFLIYLCPESPRWYIKKGRFADALKSLIILRNHKLQAARDLYYIHAQLEVEKEFIGDSTYSKRLVELFTIPRVRRATLASGIVMLAQQMCGINIIAFYSSTVFKQAGFTDYQALLASFGFGAVNFIFAFPAFFTIDTFGRRSLLLFTFPCMALSLLGAGLSTLIPGEQGPHLGMVAFFVFLFAAFYSPGEGPVPFTYSAEVFPLSHREAGMSWAVATCLWWATVLSLTFPLMLKGLGVLGSFLIYALFNLIALVFIFCWVPETKQRTLEELDYVFALKTSRFTKYQFGTALPWWCKRYLLFQKNAILPPLYQFDLAANSDDSDSGLEDKAKAETKEGTAVKASGFEG
ncbi:hexose transporter [Zalerion maritima]|uniref:Hexose transporter n=1 Tax=Zalerion maritima TaxID=339359 RepID=A0AAD5RVG4_9PEZI|nr:hexose transporter [Zalerion maritima]